MGNPAGNPRNLLREQQQQLIPPVPGGGGGGGPLEQLPRQKPKRKGRMTGGPQGVRETPITQPINPTVPEISTPLVSPPVPEMSYGPRPERTAMLGSTGGLPGMGFNAGMLGQGGQDQFGILGNRFPGARNEIESLRPQMSPFEAVRNRFRGLRSGMGGGGQRQMTPLRTGRVY